MKDLPLIWGELDGVDVGMMGLWNVSISKKSRVPSSLAATTLKERISVYIIKVYKFYCPSRKVYKFYCPSRKVYKFYCPSHKVYKFYCPSCKVYKFYCLSRFSFFIYHPLSNSYLRPILSS